MAGFLFALILLCVALYGYYSSIKMSRLEKEIRKNKVDYECFKCKAKFSVNKLKCPECSFVTIYGKRKSKYWLILPILGIWILMILKFTRQGVI